MVKTGMAKNRRKDTSLGTTNTMAERLEEKNRKNFFGGNQEEKNRDLQKEIQGALWKRSDSATLSLKRSSRAQNGTQNIKLGDREKAGR